MDILKKKHLWCSAAFVAAVMAGSASYGATIELVTNGGFEDGNTGFSTDFTNANGGFPGLATVSVLSSNYYGITANSGNSFLAVNGGQVPGANPSVWNQDIAVVAGTDYTLSFALGGTSAAPLPVGEVSVQFDGFEILTAAAPAAASYLSFGTSFTAPSTGTFSLSFVETSLGFGGNDYALDDISLTFDDSAGGPATVPLPAGGVLLLSALGLGALTRRRKAA
ncbi:MAG: hypothetical protein AAFZ99_02155 [Pseudomonadota bacterium]